LKLYLKKAIFKDQKALFIKIEVTMKFIFFSALILIINLVSCGSLHLNPNTRPVVQADYIQAHVEFLADDMLEGREAGTRGETLASLYISGELQKYGVQPYGDDNTYFQNFYLETVNFNNNSLLTILGTQGDTLAHFVHGEDFVGTTRYYQQLNITTGLVFAGYGIQAEEYDYDDYESIDAREQIVLILPGEPESEDSTFFAGTDRTPYSASRHKLSVAKEQGAAGIIFLSSGEHRYGWDKIRTYIERGGVKLSGEAPSSRLPYITVREKTIEKIIELEGMEYDSLFHQRKGFVLKNKVQADWQFKSADTLIARNVLGLIPGKDANLKDEIVVIGAHYDHVGVSEQGVFNGADDNASGTSAILETVRVLALDAANKRSILVALYSAEEKGLLGSRFLTDSLAVVSDMVGKINLDMIGRGPVDTIYSIGSDKISQQFHQLVEEANRRSANFCFDYKFNDPNDPQRLYYRSDHYNYARFGIPVVFFFDYQMQDYHQVTDDLEKLNIQKIVNVVELARETVLRIANHDQRLDKRELADK
jgi:hypothetical protein